jgi:uncharacterized repeat protein (TIGR01451 family)
LQTQTHTMPDHAAAVRVAQPHHPSRLARLALAVALCSGCPAMAQVTSSLLVDRINTSADGREARESASSARPGDQLAYAAAYANTGKQAVRQLEATLPIPTGTTLLAGSAKPVGARASTDGLRFAGMPLKRRVKTADGRDIEELVPLAEYRYLRWLPQDLAAGASTTVMARVKLDAGPATPPVSPPAAR